MNAVLKTFLSMSFSGGLLILALLLGKRPLQDKLSRQWQYYIWLVVILRLLLPFGPETNLLGKAYQAVDQAVTLTAPLPWRQPAQNASEGGPAPAAGTELDRNGANRPAEEWTAAGPLQETGALLAERVWLVWLAVALGLLIRKVTVYQGFMRYLGAGLVPVSDMEMLDRLSVAAERAGSKKPVELCVNPLVSSPMLIGFFRPCIVLPRADIPEKDFQHIVLHELTHYRRRDLLYKWLVQISVCLHWFNPLVYLMSREIARACEFSCDEAVLAKLGEENARDYGETLLDAMAAVGKYRENPGAVTLSENKQLLKERLGAIMNFRRKPAAVRLLTGALTLCMILGAAFVGVYPAAAAGRAEVPPRTPEDRNPARGSADAGGKDYGNQAERYYEAGSLPLFQIAFSRLDESAQRAWLEKLYADGDFGFFSAAVRGLGENSSLFDDFAETAYADEEIAFFSTLADCMDEAEWERWLDRALEDGKWSFQSMLFNRLDRGDEWEERKAEKEKEWAAAQMAEYQAAGIAMDGKNYYYKDRLVNVFLDIRADNSFYTLDINPAGTVNVRIVRDADDRIAGVVYMTEEEVTELLEDMADDGDDWEDSRKITIPVEISSVKDGKYIWLGTYDLSGGDRVYYHVSAETGKQLSVGFAKPGQERPDPTYHTISNLREDGKLEVQSGAVDWKVASGEYRLFIHTEGGSLTGVTGYVKIIKAAADG